MRSNILILSLVAGMTFSGAAFAATTTTKAATAMATTAVMAPVAPSTTAGTITKVNAKGLYIVLSDGWKYHVAAGFSLKDFKVGEKVSITYALKGKHHNVTAMTAA